VEIDSPTNHLGDFLSNNFGILGHHGQDSGVTPADLAYRNARAHGGIPHSDN